MKKSHPPKVEPPFKVKRRLVGEYLATIVENLTGTKFVTHAWYDGRSLILQDPKLPGSKAIVAIEWLTEDSPEDVAAIFMCADWFKPAPGTIGYFELTAGGMAEAISQLQGAFEILRIPIPDDIQLRTSR